MSNFRVVFITTGYPTEYRPHECVFIHRSIKALSESIQPDVIHLRALKPGRPIIEKRVWEGINITSISCPQLPLGSYSHFNTRLMEIFGKPLIQEILRSADLIFGAEAYPAGYLSGMWAFSINKPYMLNVIGSDLNLFLKRNQPYLGKHWLTNLRGVVCNSKSLMADFQQLFGELPNVKTIYRGVDTKTFSPDGSKTGPQSLLTPVRFLYLGGFHSWNNQKSEFNLKGGHTLLEAWKIVEKKLPTNATLAIGGPGAYQEHLQLWKTTLLYPQKVFIINSVPPEEVANYIRSSDIVIVPSQNEGLPNIAKEAQACSRPVIASNVGGIPEVVQNGRTGLIVAPGNPNDLADGIKWFCDNQDQIIKMGKNGRDRMINYFSWEQYRTEMVQFLGLAYQVNSEGKLD